MPTLKELQDKKKYRVVDADYDRVIYKSEKLKNHVPVKYWALEIEEGGLGGPIDTIYEVEPISVIKYKRINKE